MNTRVPFLFLLLLLVGCQSATDKTAGKQSLAAPASLENFADSMVRLDKYALPSLNKAADYYQRLVPADSLLADSAAVLFLQQVYSVVDSTNGRLFNDTADYFDLVYRESDTVPETQKAFRQNLQRHHLLLQGDGEGGVYAVADHAWINSVLQPKTSTAVDRYLNLLAAHETAPPLLDAGLAIDMNDLVDRTVQAEALQSAPLPKRFAAQVGQLYKQYTSILLFGSDNTPALEFEKTELTTPFEEGYRYLQARYPATETARRINEWKAAVAAKDKASLAAWRKRYLGEE